MRSNNIVIVCDFCGKRKTWKRRGRKEYTQQRNYFCSKRCHLAFQRHAPCLLCGKVDPKKTPGRTCGDCRHMYNTVQAHWFFIFRPDETHRSYVGMLFCDDWNPKKGGAYINGARWIYKNLGPRPAANWTLDIISHVKGFVPGNLRWACKRSQTDNRQHRIPGKMTDAEFAAEARRRGWKKRAA